MFDFDEINSTTRLYLTSNDKSNFRYARATTQPYKGNRVGIEKPFYLSYCKKYLQEVHGAQYVYGMEADDELSIQSSKDIRKDVSSVLIDADIVANITAFKAKKMADKLDMRIDELPYHLLDKDMDNTLDHIGTACCDRGVVYIATADKDLDMTYASIYNIRTRKIIEPGDYLELSDNRKKLFGRGYPWFFAQMLLGDACDHIPKVAKGYGPVYVFKSLYHLSEDCSWEAFLDATWKIYKAEHTHTGAKERFLEVAALLWMKTVQIPDIELYLENEYDFK